MAPRCSAGIMLWRRTPAGHQVLIAHMGGPLWAKKDERAWTIPKGEYVRDGPDAEDPLSAAYREFAEELGSPPPAGAVTSLGEITQSGGKRVVAWALEGDLDVTGIVSNTFELQWPPHSGRVQSFPEVDRAAWVDLATARVKLVAAQSVFLDRLPWVVH